MNKKMKFYKMLFLFILVLLLSLISIGCEKNGNSSRKLNIETTKPEDIEYAWQKIIKSEDSFSNCGFTHFRADETCMYVFEGYGDDDLTWKIYVLDSEWEDADRFIPQKYGDGEASDIRMLIKEGQYVYVQCSHNDFTEEAPLTGNFLKIYKS